MIIGITGTNGSGKGEVVQYLVEQKNFVHYSASGHLAPILIERGIELNRSNLRAVGNELREKYGAGYIAQFFIAKKEADGVKDVVIASIRSTGEVAELKKAGGILLIIDADRELRYQRIQGRRSGKDLIDFEAFRDQEEREWYGAEGPSDMNIKEVMKMADHTILNNGTKGDLYKEIDDIFAKITT